MLDTDRSAPRIAFRLLGPFGVDVDARPVDLGGLRRRAVLAVLLSAGGAAVSDSVLIEALWGERASAGVRNNLQTHVSRLRRAHPDLAARVQRTANGYRLSTEPGELDLDRVDELVGVARAQATADPVGAERLLDEALAQWRGRPLDEFRDLPGWHGSGLAATQLRLDELEAALREDLLEVRLGTGRHVEALPELEQLVALRPERERAHRLLALALHRSARSDAALTALRRYRRRLAEDAGLDPSPELTLLEQAILAQDPALAAPVPAPARAPERDGTPPRRRPARGPSIHGRQDDLIRLREALAASASVTVTGPGGVGKTRLVRELIARDELDAAVAELAAVGSGEDVLRSVAGVLGVRAGPATALDDAVADYLRTRDTLLVLDDCEHLVDDVVRTVQRLLAVAPGLTVLATSRERLGLDGEQVVPLAPLPVDDHGAGGAGSPAVQLFVERARRVRPGFTTTAETLPVLVDVCRRLDGLPLAIELAAGQLGSLGLVDLRDRLGDRLDLLALPRRTTLREVVDRSYRLLADPEQRLFERLAVFDRGFTLDAAVQVGAGGISSTGTVRALARLVDASLVTADDDGRGRLRYGMLETLRALATECLDRREPGGGTRRRHAEWVAGFAATAEGGLQGPAEGMWAERVAAEMPNIRAAWHHSVGRGDVTTAARITVALAGYAQSHEQAELWDLARMLAGHQGLPGTPLFVAVQGAAAQAAYLRGDLDEAQRYVDAGSRAADAATERAWWCPAAATIVALFRGEHGRAEQLARRALAGADSPLWRVILHGDIALARLYGGDVRAARSALLPCARLADEAGIPTGRAWARYVEGEIGLVDDPAEAVVALRDAVSLARSVGTGFVEGVAMVSLISAAVRTGDHRTAVATLPDAVRHWQRSGMWVQQWTTLRLLAELLVDLGVEEPAAVLLSAAAADSDAPTVSGADADRAHAFWARLRSRLGAARVAELRARGTALARPEVITHALEVAVPRAVAAAGARGSVSARQGCAADVT